MQTLTTPPGFEMLDLRDSTVLMTLAEFAWFLVVVAVLMSLIPKDGAKPYRVLVGIFYLLWAVIIEEFSGMLLAVYTVGGLLLIQHLAVISPENVGVFTVAIAFIPGLLFVNLSFYIIYIQLKTRAAARGPREEPKGTLEESENIKLRIAAAMDLLDEAESERLKIFDELTSKDEEAKK